MAQTKTVTLNKIEFDRLSGGCILDVEATLRIGNGDGPYTYLSVGGPVSHALMARIRLLIEEEIAGQLGATATSKIAETEELENA